MIVTKIGLEAALSIRQRVLWPNESKEFCLVEGDDSATHYGIFLSEVLVGVASIYIASEAVRLRKFAVDIEYQGMGLGTALLSYVLGSLESSEATVFWCDARASAREFYERFGLSVDGDIFYKSAVPYYKMSLIL